IDGGRIKLADQLAEGDWALIFVAMIARLEDHRRASAIFDDGKRNAGGAPGVLMRRVGDIDKPDLLAVAVEIDGGVCGAHTEIASAGRGNGEWLGREEVPPRHAAQIGGSAGNLVPIHFSESADSEPSSIPRWI